MERRRVVTAVLVLAVPALALGPATAAGTGVGQTAANPAAVLGCAGQNVHVQDDDAGAASYVTTPGVITSWSLMASSYVAPVRLKIVREGSPSSYLVTGVSQLRTPSANTLNTFPDRIPVVAGDRLALYIAATSGVASCDFATGNASDVVATTNTSLEPDHAVGQSFFTTGSSLPSRRVNVSAVIEPDADGDGYGDLTQDGCPGRGDKTTECTPPDTAASGPEKVRTTKKRAKVTLLLVSEAGATFTCAVDGAKAKPCGSPFKVKLKAGKHHVAVTATDAAGNSDPTPAQVTVKVKRKKG